MVRAGLLLEQLLGPSVLVLYWPAVQSYAGLYAVAELLCRDVAVTGLAEVAGIGIGVCAAMGQGDYVIHHGSDTYRTTRQAPLTKIISALQPALALSNASMAAKPFGLFHWFPGRSSTRLRISRSG